MIAPPIPYRSSNTFRGPCAPAGAEGLQTEVRRNDEEAGSRQRRAGRSAARTPHYRGPRQRAFNRHQAAGARGGLPSGLAGGASRFMSKSTLAYSLVVLRLPLTGPTADGRVDAGLLQMDRRAVPQGVRMEPLVGEGGGGLFRPTEILARR